jgi:hypothetical protein
MAASSLDKAGTAQHRQMVRVRQARRKGVREKPAAERPSRQSTSSNLMDMGWVAARIGPMAPRTLRPIDVVGQEATVKACGVVVAMLQGHSWAPTPSSGSRVNVGTIPVAPSPASNQLAGGKARRRLTPPGWDGGPVVVRGRESRLHGEGVQRDRSIHAEHGVRW